MSQLNYFLIAVASVAVLLAGAAWWFARLRIQTIQGAQEDQLAALRGELASLAERLDQAETPKQPEGLSGGEAVVITRVGEDQGASGSGSPAASGRIVLSAAVGEPLVRTAAVLHGVRRALAPETRNRIRFEMKREVRRSRKQRKQDMKAAYRQMRQGDLGESRTA